jgi:two-component system, repressor protein LuxO
MVISEQTPPVILLVEDTAVLIQVYIKFLRAEHAEVVAVETLSAAREFIAARAPTVVLLDINLPDGSGLDLLRDIRRRGLDTAVVVITADGSIDGAVAAMRLGADDILIKPFPPERLSTTLKHVLERRRLARIAETIPPALDADGFEGFIGASPAMRAVYTVIERTAQSRAWVFITGESGTGKTVCAQAIHRRSALHLGPFVALDCSTLPKDRIESEIFGQVKGGSSGAVADREGAVARANGGTLFLDGICEMDAAMQVRLLRFVQTGLVQRVGSDASLKVDVRILCATNRDPIAEVAAGRFREDLYYRLHVVPIALPALRERGDDVLLMARRFLAQFGAEEGKQFAGFAPGTEDLLLAEPWPGNVRQLQNVIRTIAVLGKGGIVTPGMLPREMRSAVARSILRHQPHETAAGSFGPAVTNPALRSLAEVERVAIEDAIVLCNGNLTEAAKHLDINVSTIHRKRQSWLTQAN